MQARADERAAPLTCAHIHRRRRRAPMRRAAAPLWVGREAHPEIVLPAGDYTVTAQNGVARQQSKVTIAPATGTNFNSMLAVRIARAQRHARHRRRPGDPVTEGVTFILAQDDPDAPQGRREVARSAAPRADLHAARRHLLRDGAHAVAPRCASRSPSAPATSSSAPCRCRWRTSSSPRRWRPAAGAADKPVTYRVVRLDGEPREIARTIAQRARVRSFRRTLSPRSVARRQQRHRRHRDRARRGPGAEDHAAARRRQRHA